MALVWGWSHVCRPAVVECVGLCVERLDARSCVVVCDVRVVGLGGGGGATGVRVAWGVCSGVGVGLVVRVLSHDSGACRSP